MRNTILLLILTISFLQCSCNIIVDREIDMTSLAESIPTTVKYTFYNTHSKDVYNIELEDKHLSNDTYFTVLDQQAGFSISSNSIKIFIDHLPGKEKITKEIRVAPKEYGDHTFEAASYKYTLEPGQDAP